MIARTHLFTSPMSSARSSTVPTRMTWSSWTPPTCRASLQCDHDIRRRRAIYKKVNCYRETARRTVSQGITRCIIMASIVNVLVASRVYSTVLAHCATSTNRQQTDRTGVAYATPENSSKILSNVWFSACRLCVVANKHLSSYAYIGLVDFEWRCIMLKMMLISNRCLAISYKMLPAILVWVQG